MTLQLQGNILGGVLMPGYAIFLLAWGIPALVTANRIHWYRTHMSRRRNTADDGLSVAFGGLFWFGFVPALVLWKAATFHPVEAWHTRKETAKRMRDATIRELENDMNRNRE